MRPGWTRGSIRYVGDDDGTQLWLARGTERDSVCLVRITNIDADDWQIGCSGAAGPLTMGSYVVHSDGYPRRRITHRSTPRRSLNAIQTALARRWHNQ